MDKKTTATSPESTAQTSTAKPFADNATKSSPLTKPQRPRILRLLLVTLAVLLSIPLLIAGWLGFVPGLSNLMGARTPNDLGITWTDQDYSSFLEKADATFADYEQAPINPDNPAKKVIFDDPKAVTDLVFTQEEITAAINSAEWAWMPVTNAQVRLSEGTVEVSGNLALDSIEKFVSYIGGVGYDSTSVESAANWGRRFVNGAPIYIKAEASVTNDELQFQLEEITIGRYSVPMDVASTVLSTGSSNSIQNTPNFKVDSATMVDGGLDFSGTYPTTVYVLRDESAR